MQKVAAEAKLQRDLRTIQDQTQLAPSGESVLSRDAHLLEGLDAASTSTTNQQLDEAYLAAFTQGAPTPQVASQLRSNLVTILGPAGTSARVAAVDRLVADAPAFYRCAGQLRDQHPDDRRRPTGRSSMPAAARRSTHSE